ncbi:MAG: hypothetical protein L3K26_14305 [Candidatus Hydrogenedentes bacterium]|nr:hypothetical protein [Candidatus Hydrogenedentota bacterium]
MLAVFAALTYFALRVRDHVPDSLIAPTQSGEERLEAYLAEKERASAYEVVRNLLDQKKEEPGIAAVYCRDCRHRWVNGRIEFRGNVDFLDGSGQFFHHTYFAVLSGTSQQGWKMESLQVTLADPLPAR